MTASGIFGSCSQAAGHLGKQLGLLASILGVSGASYLIFRLSAHGAKWLSPIVLRLVTRIMGLLLAAIAVQFAFNALQAQKGVLW